MLNFPGESAIFFKKHGYALNIKNPQSFSEKVIWKKLYDRNPLLPIVSDKLRVQNYITEKLGQQLAEVLLVPIYFHGQYPEAIPFSDLPDQFVIKQNNASGRNIFVWDKKSIDEEEIVKKCKNWLSKTYGVFRHEWAYQKIKNEILVEKLLVSENGDVPIDFKFHVIHGKCKLIDVCFDKLINPYWSAFDENWINLNIYKNYPKGPIISQPDNYLIMLRIAEELGYDFDYLRVDLLSINKHIYFSELTCYPMSGDAIFNPPEFDFELGSYWKIDRNYWKKKYSE